MNIYLVNIEYRVSQYMIDGEDLKSKTHLVYAENETDASDKITKHYEDKSSPYSTYYSIHDVEVCETIM